MAEQLPLKTVVMFNTVLVEAWIIGAYKTVDGVEGFVYQTESKEIFLRPVVYKPEKRGPTIDLSKGAI